ncbi:MAG: hypothetical protein ACKVOW_09585 [Chitinophagaceae bacterium]
MSEDKNNIVNENAPDYEKAEMDLLRDALKKTYMERFETMMNLIKMNLMFRKAKIIHQKDNSG